MPLTDAQITLLNDYVASRRVVVFTAAIRNAVLSRQEPGMKAVIVAWQPFGGKREELLQFKFDFARFKALNEGLMTPKYLDINLKPTLKWSGTQFFPRDGVVVDYQKIDDVFGAHPVFTVE